MFLVRPDLAQVASVEVTTDKARTAALSRLAWALLAACCATLGLLGHLTFLHALAGLIAYVLLRGGRAHPGRLVADLRMMHERTRYGLR